MILFSVLYIMAAFIYLYMGYVMITNDSKSKGNRIFFTICLIMFLWSLLYGACNANTEVIIAVVFRRYAVLAWSILYSKFLHFFIILTKRDVIIEKWRILKWLLYIPALFSVFLYFIYQPIGVQDIARTAYGWVYLSQNRNGWLWENYLNLYYISYLLLCIYLVVSWGIRSKVRREKNQAKIITLTMIVTILLSTITDVLLPVRNAAVIPPVTVFFSLILVYGIWFTMKKYGFMNFNQENMILDLLKVIDEGLITLNQDEQIVSANQGALRLLGYQEEAELVSKSIDVIFPMETDFSALRNVKSCELELKTKNDQKTPVLLHSLTMTDHLGDVLGTLISFQDLTVINEALKMKQYAYYDGLTNLPNRRLLDDHLKWAINEAKREKTLIAVLFIDIDYFKMINDSLGHSEGDEFLKQVSDRMSNIIEKSDTLARVGGDEFILMLRNMEESLIEKICSKMLDSFNEPFYINGKELFVTSSIGVSIYPNDGVDGETLIKHADQAMYQAKNNGKNQVEFFDSNWINNSLSTL